MGGWGSEARIGPASASSSCYCGVLCAACLLAQSRPTLCNSLDCSPPGSSVHGIFQARILEWVAISFSRGSYQPRDQTHVSWISCIAGEFFTHWAMSGETHKAELAQLWGGELGIDTPTPAAPRACWMDSKTGSCSKKKTSDRNADACSWEKQRIWAGHRQHLLH